MLSRMEEKVLVTRSADEETEDGRIRNKEAISKIRDAWIYKQIRSRVNEFTQYKQVRIYIVFVNKFECMLVLVIKRKMAFLFSQQT